MLGPTFRATSKGKVVASITNAWVTPLGTFSVGAAKDIVGRKSGQYTIILKHEGVEYAYRVKGAQKIEMFINGKVKQTFSNDLVEINVVGKIRINVETDTKKFNDSKKYSIFNSPLKWIKSNWQDSVWGHY